MAVKGSVPKPGVIVPHLVVRDAAEALAFYEEAFRAEVLYRSPSPSGVGEHIHVRMWDSLVQLSTQEPRQRGERVEGALLASPETLSGSTCVFQIGVDDVDVAFKRAVDCGASPALPPTDMFWGDRYGWGAGSVRACVGVLGGQRGFKSRRGGRPDARIRSGDERTGAMRWMLRVLLMLVAMSPMIQAGAQSAAPTADPKPDPFKALGFLEGSWEAKTNGAGGVNVIGTYAFQKELGGHVMARVAISQAGCSGPKEFDCEHGDLLYVFPEVAGLKAIYKDNEGHVIHYGVTEPTPTSVEFLSEGPGPVFRLTYELKDSVMAGRFEMKMPGGTDWKPYLTWSGARVGK